MLFDIFVFSMLQQCFRKPNGMNGESNLLTSIFPFCGNFFTLISPFLLQKKAEKLSNHDAFLSFPSSSFNSRKRKPTPSLLHTFSPSLPHSFSPSQLHSFPTSLLPNFAPSPLLPLLPFAPSLPPLHSFAS